MKFPILFFMAILAAFISGCSTTESENVRTQGIRAEIRVIAISSDVDTDAAVEVYLFVGSGGVGGTLVEISGGDGLRAYLDGVAYELTKTSDLFGVYYAATLPTSSVNTLYQVSFERDEGVSATESSVMLPEPFEITSDTSISATNSATLDITWSPQGAGKLTLMYRFSCEGGTNLSSDLFGSRSIDDDGAFQMDLGDYLAADVTQCEGVIDLERTSSGTLDTNFGEGGYIQGVQHRSMNIAVSE